jgi:hypothetical protein
MLSLEDPLLDLLRWSGLRSLARMPGLAGRLFAIGIFCGIRV